MSELNFVETYIPETETRGRTAGPNPFDGHFPTLEGRSLTVTIPGKDGNPDKTAIDRLTRQARAAANVLSKSARIVAKRTKTAKGDDTKDGNTVFSVWTVDQVKRPRKPKNETETAPSETESAE